MRAAIPTVLRRLAADAIDVAILGKRILGLGAARIEGSPIGYLAAGAAVLPGAA